MDGRHSRCNERDGVLYRQPVDVKQRSAICTSMCNDLSLTFPAVIDNMDNAVKKAYRAAPIRLYVVDVDGNIAYQGDRGPRSFSPTELNLTLHDLLDE